MQRTKPSKTAMMWGWQRPRRLSELRSQGYVETTASKYGMRPLTRLGLRPLLYLGEQRLYTILLLSAHQAWPFPRLTLPPRWRNLGRAAQLKSPLPLTALPRRLNSRGLLRKKLMLTREWPLMPPSPLLFLKIHIKRKRCPPRWR